MSIKIITLVYSFVIPILGNRQSVAFVSHHTVPRRNNNNNNNNNRLCQHPYDDGHFATAAIDDDDDDHDHDIIPVLVSSSSSSTTIPTGTATTGRRDFLSKSGIRVLVTTTGLLTSNCLFPPQILLGITTSINDIKLNNTISTTSNTTTLSAIDIANLLNVIPTYTIVDTDGVPYMVVGEDAKVTGYFFTTYTEAQRILTLARTSVDQSISEEITKLKRSKITVKDSASSTPPSVESDSELFTNPWKLARISTVPLDAAITLSLKGLNGNVRNYFQVAAAATDINDALQITNKTDLAEGKVPLFYFEDFTLDTKKIPLYFQKDQLIGAYRKQYPRKTLPPILVTELFAVLTSMVSSQQQQPTTTASNGTKNDDNDMNNNNDDDDDDDDDDLQNIIFVPPINSQQWVEQCTIDNQGKAAFVVGKRNIVL